MTVKTTVPILCTPPFPNISQHTEHHSRSRPRLSSLRNIAGALTQEVCSMTAPYNPRAAADQARATYRAATAQLGQLGLDTAIPEDMRTLAVKTVAQSREAYDRSKDAFEASLTAFETSFDAAGQGAVAFNRKIVDIARRNVDATFDLAQTLTGAKNFADMMELQAAFWRKQLGALTAQAEEVRALSTKVTADASEPLKARLTQRQG
jgi:phasin